MHCDDYKYKLYTLSGKRRKVRIQEWQENKNGFVGVRIVKTHAVKINSGD